MIFMCIVSLIVSKTIIYRLPQQCFIFNKYLINWKNLVRQKIKKCFANCNGKITMGEKKRENRKTFLDELIILFVLYIAQIFWCMKKMWLNESCCEKVFWWICFHVSLSIVFYYYSSLLLDEEVTLLCDFSYIIYFESLKEGILS